MDETMSGVGATWADASVLEDVRRQRAEPMQQTGADFGAVILHVQRTRPAIGPDLPHPVHIRDTGFELIDGETRMRKPGEPQPKPPVGIFKNF
ncbi:MAG: hypothetical protein LOY00_13835 [Methylocaldum sp.]|nr:hypothetical protein [Methylocaldum sp.]